MDGSTPLLMIDNLSISYPSNKGLASVIRNLSLNMRETEMVGVVGESGSGKSQTALAVLGLLDANAQVSGSIKFQGEELLDVTERKFRKIRGSKISMVFQDPMTALNPYLKIGKQITESLCLHRGMSQTQANSEAVRWLDAVRISSAASRLNQYPGALSGGMRQRVMLAMAMCTQPKLLIADEPTTALDVTVQSQVLKLMKELCLENNTAVLLISHDLGVVAETTQRIIVMYAGEKVEEGATAQLLNRPLHPYTQALLSSMPKLTESIPHRMQSLAGQPPSAYSKIKGCSLAPRCPKAIEICANEVPQWRKKNAGGATCHLIEE